MLGADCRDFNPTPGSGPCSSELLFVCLLFVCLFVCYCCLV